jgi:uncharacterized protein (TIGR03382 family)
MRRASLLAVLALPAVAAAQVTPTPTAGSITFPTQVNTAVDKYINAAECRSGTITLRWAISFDTNKGVANLASYQLYASDHAEDSAVNKERCPTENDDKLTGVHAGSIVDAITTNLSDPSPELEFDTALIASVAGLGACNASGTTIMLCVQARDSSDGLIGTARTNLTLSTTAPGAPESASASPGEQALDVHWGDSSGEPTPEYHIAEVVTGPGVDPTVSTSTSKASGAVAGTGSGSVRIDGLTNGVIYAVYVTAYSTADNASDPVFAGTASPTPVNDFWETYRAAGGREQGGCASGAGAAGTLALLAAASLVALFRRRK